MLMSVESVLSAVFECRVQNRVKTNRRMDRRTEAIALPPPTNAVGFDDSGSTGDDSG